jgi:AcrR family transcriptional regulator
MRYVIGVARTLDSGVDAAIAAAAMALLSEQGFGAMTIEAVAARARVGKPAIYRRFADKAALVTDVIARQLPELEVGDLGDSRAELWQAVVEGFPADAPSYVRLIGGLIAEEERHPELIAAFRENVLGPRRAFVRSLIERGQTRREIRAAVDPVAAVDSLAGPLLARAFAGIETGPEWRRESFDTWWENVREKEKR